MGPVRAVSAPLGYHFEGTGGSGRFGGGPGQGGKLAIGMVIVLCESRSVDVLMSRLLTVTVVDERCAG